MRGMNEKELRKWLCDYYRAAVHSGYGVALLEVSRVERASTEELLMMAREAGLKINRI